MLDAVASGRASGGQTRPPTPPASTRAAARAAQAGCRRVSATIWSRTRSSSRPGMAEARSRRASPFVMPSTASSGKPSSTLRRSARGRRTAWRSSPPAGAAPRMQAPAWRLDRATARRRPDTRADRPRPPRRADSGPQERRGTDPGRRLLQPERDAQRIPLRTRQLLEPVESGRAQLMQSGKRELHLGLHARGSRDTTPDARSATYSSSAVLPTPASPRSTSTELCPGRMRCSCRSRASHSLWRPCST